MEPKAQKRASILQKRQQLNLDFIAAASAQVARAVFELPEYSRCKRLGLYAPFRNEIATDAIFQQALQDGKVCYYPKVLKEKSALAFIRVKTPSELSTGFSGILEPAGEVLEDVCLLEMLVIPGVAFDVQGNRLGYGQGFYDRLLHNYGGVKCALAYEFQLSDALPNDSADEKID